MAQHTRFKTLPDGGVAGPGNITTQTGIGTYSYPAAGQPRPHAVTSITGTFNGITNPSFSYDANGNMTNRAGSTVGWSSYNYPISISASDVTGTEEVQFSYGPDRQRWKQTYTSPSPTEFTYYVGGLVDVVFVNSTTNYRHYIYAGGEPIAVYSRTAAGVNTMSYMLEDHQGGVSNIASNSGASDVNESFSAFGTRRNPTTWSGAPTTADLNTIAGLSRQGYTFQTWLGQSMGLNHMNGRVQDAILGRFLSPDVHVTDSSNPQNYNRYSYVNNNPLTMVDPTGFDGCPGLSEGGDCVTTSPSGGGSDLVGSRGVGLVDCSGNCPGSYITTVLNTGQLASTISVGDLGGLNSLSASGPANIGLAAGTDGSSLSPIQTSAQLIPAAEMVVTAPNAGAAPSFPTIYGSVLNGQIPCGAVMCTYNISSYIAMTSPKTVGANLVLHYPGPGGGSWVQTYTNSDTNGAFVADIGNNGDPMNPFYPSNMLTNSNQFWDQPGQLVSGFWLGETSLVQPNGNGGFSAAFTFMWGFLWSPDGQFVPIGPVPASMWNSQQQNIWMLH
jgi:RHS repeat-associated protein